MADFACTRCNYHGPFQEFNAGEHDVEVQNDEGEMELESFDLLVCPECASESCYET